MKIVFALVVYSCLTCSSSTAIKVGEYEKYSQCVEQGAKLVKRLTNVYGLTDSRYFLYDCTPVNATGTK